jgi:transposase
MGFGYVQGVTHDDRRHGTTTLFAALDLLDGAVLTQCRPRHRHQEVLSFLRTIEKAVPADLEIHIVRANYATHKHPKVKAWLAARPRCHLHFVPTYSSWLNLVERFFAHLSEGDPARLVRLGARPDGQDRPLRHPLQPNLPTLRLDGERRFDPRQAQRLCSRINGTGH